MFLESLLVGVDDRPVGVAAVEHKAADHAVAGAPLTIGNVVVAPKAPVVPDAAGVIIQLGPFGFMGLAHQFYFVALIHLDVFEEAPAPAVRVLIQREGRLFLSRYEKKYASTPVDLGTL